MDHLSKPTWGPATTSRSLVIYQDDGNSQSLVPAVSSRKRRKQQTVEEHSLGRVEPMFSVHGAHLRMLICFRL
jgi:hypothetical protein